MDPSPENGIVEVAEVGRLVLSRSSTGAATCVDCDRLLAHFASLHDSQSSSDIAFMF